jgi:hypothetical protein
MDIKEFIAETLKQIIDGVVDAQKYAKNKNAVIVPWHDSQKVVDFDVAVTVADSKETGGKAGISVWSIGANINRTSECSSSTTSRIRFEIPVELPRGSEAPALPDHTG